MYVDAVYCYRPSSVVCRSVYHSREPCKNGWPIEMPFGLWARVGLRNHVLNGAQIPMGRGNFGKKRRPIVKYRDREPCKNGWPDRNAVWLWTRVGRRKHMLHGATLASPGEYDWNVRTATIYTALCQITLTTCYYCQKVEKNEGCLAFSRRNQWMRGYVTIGSMCLSLCCMRLLGDDSDSWAFGTLSARCRRPNQINKITCSQLYGSVVYCIIRVAIFIVQ